MHDALVKLGITFESPRALELADEVMALINRVARDTSIELARERGPYPECREAVPGLQEVSSNHWVACIRAEGYGAY